MNEIYSLNADTHVPYKKLITLQPGIYASGKLIALLPSITITFIINDWSGSDNYTSCGGNEIRSSVTKYKVY